MWAARNGLLVPASTEPPPPPPPAGGPVTFNALGNFTNTDGTGTAFTTITATQPTDDGDFVLCAVAYAPANGGIATTSPVTCDGTDMTLIGRKTQSTGNYQIIIDFYGLADVAAGTPTIQVNTVPAGSLNMVAQSLTLSGVGSYGSALTAGGGPGYQLTHAVSGVTEGQLVVEALVSRGWNGTAVNHGLDTISGGTLKWHGHCSISGGYDSPDMVLNIADADTTFYAEIVSNANDYWAGLALVFSG